MFLIADLRRRQGWKRTMWLGGILLGAGLFQLYDGTIQHKLMLLHQIRYNVDVFPYDFVWNLSAIAMIIVGYLFIQKSRKGKPIFESEKM